MRNATSGAVVSIAVMLAVAPFVAPPAEAVHVTPAECMLVWQESSSEPPEDWGQGLAPSAADYETCLTGFHPTHGDGNGSETVSCFWLANGAPVPVVCATSWSGWSHAQGGIDCSISDCCAFENWEPPQRCYKFVNEYSGASVAAHDGFASASMHGSHGGGDSCGWSYQDLEPACDEIAWAFMAMEPCPTDPFCVQQSASAETTSPLVFHSGQAVSYTNPTF